MSIESRQTAIKVSSNFRSKRYKYLECLTLKVTALQISIGSFSFLLLSVVVKVRYTKIYVDTVFDP
jgi:hypothetical protein